MLGALSAIALVLGSGSPFDGAARWVRLLVTGALVASVIAVVSASPLGRLSGAHLNPAVTVAFGVLGMVPRRDLLGYVVAQLAGALAGAAAFRVAWGSVAASVEGGVTHPSIAVAGAIGLEAAMTAALLAVILRVRLARTVGAVDAAGDLAGADRDGRGGGAADRREPQPRP